jgi:uncharacterized FAD-dependent dehydrogenase
MPLIVELKIDPKAEIDFANDDISVLKTRALKQSGLVKGSAFLRKKSLDARGKKPYYLYRFEVYAENETAEITRGFYFRNVTNAREIHIVGFGPAGIFAALQCIENGYKPVIFERGKSVKERRRDLAELNRTLHVNPESNYCFGEGGAGTYSDGKLYTRSDKRGPVKKVLQTLVDHGAGENIIWDAHPHIGTNKLPGIIENLRNFIISCAGEIHFNKKLTGIIKSNNEIKSITINGNEKVPVKVLILATGHSARDIFELLHNEKIAIEAKPFALGVRLEHPQELIDSIQYKCEVRNDFLPPSSYSIVEQITGKGVFSFCMCPGGIIAPSATNDGEVVVNGWSPSKRNGKFANSGFVVGVDDTDFKPFESQGPLKAMAYQEYWERKAFETANNIQAPAQRMEDFIQKKRSTQLPACSYIPGIVSRELDEVLEKTVAESIRRALIKIGTKMKGFRTNEAVLVGVESRSSSPVRIPRVKDLFCHNEIENLYPCAEGAGYAGGIMSAALDGIKLVEAICEKIK